MGVLLLSVGSAAGPYPVIAQEGTGTSTLAGTALGLYSGGALGLVGSLLPCNRTLFGAKCTAFSGIAGGLVGGVAGGLVGDLSEDEVRDRARGALYGTVIGGAVGVLLQQAVRQYAWNDALLVAGYGAAVGAAPWGVLIGTGAGAVVGGLVWLGDHQDGLANLMMLTVLGGAVGGLVDWAVGALDSNGGSGPMMTTSFSIPLG